MPSPASDPLPAAAHDLRRLVARGARCASFAVALLVGALPAPAQDDAQQRWQRFEPEFQAFAAADQTHPPTRDAILFVGSSIFRQWTDVAERMAPLPVLNRAFGGSRTGDQLARYDQLIPRYTPRVVVYYCGSNDLKAGATPEDPPRIFARFAELAERARRDRPGLRLIFVSSTRSPDRVARWTQVDHYNALARAYCTANPGCTFVDINPALVDADGRPRLELYRDDKLHLTPAAYAEVARILQPVLESVWADVQARP